ncbi:sensor histidine kinase [Paenibacillus sepulcri]|uniref:histidine kinase n=1 Tax=Paenibacillus sepulcri TaxID=359917 RepID=A0ABS7C3J1_9BACL|nr:GHKL domain-containing protein [Paenibacillus sepulcri]
MPVSWEPILSMLEQLIALTIPQAFFYTWFGFMWLGIIPRNVVRRLLLFSILSSVYIDAAYYILPKWANLINTSIGFYFWFSLFYKEIKTRSKILMLVMFNIVAFLHQLVLVWVSSYFGGMDSVTDSSFGFMVMFFGPSFVILALLTVLMQKKQIHPGKHLLPFLIHARSKPFLSLIVLFMVETCLFGLVFFPPLMEKGDIKQHQIWAFLAFLVFFAINFVLIRLFARIRKEAIHTTQEAYIGDLIQMFTSIRGQRHDFINHVQVMYAMLSMKKYDQLRSYMEDMVKEIQSMTLATNDLPSPALAALIQAKMTIAESNHIQFSYQIPETPLTFRAVSSIDFVRIIGNLVDNAFDEVMKLPETEREVILELFTNDQQLYITVTNRKHTLSEEEMKRILEPGYTTKKGNHSGLGLSIVMERCSHYKGKLSVESDLERGVVFTIKLPLHNVRAS